MTQQLLPEERETCLTMTGDNHEQWIIFTDDPYWLRRLEKIATAIETIGEGKRFVVDASQVTIGRKRKALSADEKLRRANALRSKNTVKNADSYRDFSGQSAKPDSLAVRSAL